MSERRQSPASMRDRMSRDLLDIVAESAGELMDDESLREFEDRCRDRLVNHPRPVVNPTVQRQLMNQVLNRFRTHATIGQERRSKAGPE